MGSDIMQGLSAEVPKQSAFGSDHKPLNEATKQTKSVTKFTVMDIKSHSKVVETVREKQVKDLPKSIISDLKITNEGAKDNIPGSASALNSFFHHQQKSTVSLDGKTQQTTQS